MSYDMNYLYFNYNTFAERVFKFISLFAFYVLPQSWKQLANVMFDRFLDDDVR